RTSVQDSKGGTTTSTYDAANELTLREFGGASQTFIHVVLGYTPAGQLNSIARDTGPQGPYNPIGTSSMTYDAAGNLKELQHKDSTGTNIAYYTYSYDPGDRLTSEQRNGTTVTYTYDDSSQLTGDGVNSLSFDGAGNRTNGSNTTGTGNQLSSDGTWTYS